MVIKRTTFITILILIAFFAGQGCSGPAPQTAIPLPLPTYTHWPTYTPYPTYTAIPQITPTDPLPAGGIFACIPNHDRQTGRVVRVVDGDTIDVEINGEEFPVRYIGIDTPEIVKPNTPVQYYGPEASEKNKELVDGKTVILVKDISDVDQYERLLRYVIVEGKFVNYELVAQGFAKNFAYPPDTSCNETIYKAELDARNSILGLWAPPTPLPTMTKKPTATEAPTATRFPTATEYPQRFAPLALDPTQEPQPQSNCDPAYPGVCIPPSPPDLDCGDISYRRFQVLPPDPHRFDGDHDGIGCES